MGAVSSRILYVNHEVECGGAERSLLDLLGGLDRERFAPLLACPEEGPLAEAARRLAVPVHFAPLRARRRLGKLFRLPRAAKALARLMRDEEISLVHTNTLLAGYAGLWAARRTGVPCVWHLRDLSYPAVARRICARADRVIANSAATAATLRGCENVRVVHNGVDESFFDAGESGAVLRREMGVAKDARIVGMVGRLDPWKGHEDLLEAVPNVPDAEFWIVGDVLFSGARARLAGYRARLEARTRVLGVSGRVRFLGPRTDIPAVMAALDVLVHPSREPEPFGRSAAEAQACGKPVVATRAGGIVEIVEDQTTGLLVPPRDSAALASAVRGLLEDPDRARRMGAEGRARARARFTVARHVEGVRAVYDELG